MLNYFILIISLTFSIYANALENNNKLSIEMLQQQINHFKQSPSANYAKTTLQRAQAYLGAAMLARDDENEQATQTALKKAQETLTEATANAQYFQKTFAKLLRLQRSTTEAVEQLPHDNNPLKKPNPALLLKAANQALRNVVSAVEQGALNKSQQEALLARTKFMAALNTSLPQLIELTSDTLSHASSKNAKYYAPTSYEQAKQALATLKLYQDGIINELPKHPAHALELAKLTLQISTNVKAWRRNKASHEMLWLEARDQRQQLAKRLHLALQHDDIALNSLLDAIESLQLELQKNNQDNQDKSSQLQAAYHKDLQAALDKQKLILNKACEEQAQSMKDIFRVKLERETFETKRQKRIQALFPKHGANIIANLDGSLILRLSSLKFSPGSSKIDAAFFDLLKRVKNVLDIYGDRNFRIEGHTDTQGPLKANQRLSLKRAEAVRDFLIATGADASTIKALGYGEVRPIASNDFAKGRDMNRRIDIVIEARNDQ